MQSNDTQQPEILIIGYGNPLRGDDGLGWHIASTLAEKNSQQTTTSPLRVLPRHQLTPELAEPISQAIFVIFIDARLGETPGQIQSLMLTPQASTDAFTHHVDPASLLLLAQSLYGSCPPAALLSITGDSFGYNEYISPVVQQRLPTLMQQLEALIEQARLLNR